MGNEPLQANKAFREQLVFVFLIHTGSVLAFRFVAQQHNN